MEKCESSVAKPHVAMLIIITKKTNVEEAFPLSDGVTRS